MSKKTWIAVVVAVVLVFIFFGFDSIFNALIWSDTPADTSLQADVTETPMDITGLTIEDVVVGTGAEAKAGTLVSVHYTGTFTNGIKFDSSVDRGKPIQFILGSGYVIPGWDKGLLGMKVGGKRKLTIAPELAYGSTGQGAIPPNSTLLFDVELVAVDTAPAVQN